MVKPFLILVVSVSCAGLLLPAAATASHWNPPPWFNEAMAGGRQVPPGTEPNRNNLTCELQHGGWNREPGSHMTHFDCIKKRRNGYVQCGGMARVERIGQRDHYTCWMWLEDDPATLCEAYASVGWNDIQVPPWGVLRSNTRAVTGGYSRHASTAPDSVNPKCLELLSTRRFGPDRDKDRVVDGQDRCVRAAGPQMNRGCPLGKSGAPPKGGTGGGTSGKSGGGGDSAGGHDLVSLCGTARFDWYRTNTGDPDVEKGQDACLHVVSNRVAQELAADGIKAMGKAFGQGVFDWAKGKLEPDAGDALKNALPAWDRAFRTAGRLNVLTEIGKAAGVAGAALGYTWAASHIANKDACAMFVTSTSTNLSIDGADSGSSFTVNGWQMVYNREHVKDPKRDVGLHTAGISQKVARRLARDRWEKRLTSMRCGAGGKVFLAKEHDESAIVANRVRAAG